MGEEGNPGGRRSYKSKAEYLSNCSIKVLSKISFPQSRGSSSSADSAKLSWWQTTSFQGQFCFKNTQSSVVGKGAEFPFLKASREEYWSFHFRSGAFMIIYSFASSLLADSIDQMLKEKVMKSYYKESLMTYCVEPSSATYCHLWKNRSTQNMFSNKMDVLKKTFCWQYSSSTCCCGFP